MSTEVCNASQNNSVVTESRSRIKNFIWEIGLRHANPIKKYPCLKITDDILIPDYDFISKE